ncbi:SDR family NAD(P)-dependent oxidoreductase [Natronobacterium gregoryi]|uniref:NAD(P)-dependent oxidoreductase n=2 Tax=Natronobacterium gregoryi TaxID=44930 RepID=L0AIK6_NATGS|nr:SDR family oxidoreductase [Natronobacterium gregoryi]AFZ73611.1 short-chain alcohol dehydrogenase [Natronobacterium gregoryi SP2]ELY67894.1 short-chain family oxidoreductase [Natronobacterium gregoryi SP2]PLK20000.1 NAD(P)-dependent oxidoreductase [Natronobacterium gregoryi SP2]SFJ34259.1 NADP-dependent 3-hydroxy acid dehydrogenase YdfG [Natronobacterium gregoryi]
MTTQTILLTGASGGIGTAVADAFAGDGWRTILCGRSRESLESTAETVSEAGGTPVVRPLDVRDEDAVFDTLLETIPETLDVLLPAAAVMPHAPGERPLDEEYYEDVRTVLDTNVYGLFTVLREALQFMPSDGRVLVPSGSVARDPKPGMGTYAPSKAAAEALARGFAIDVDQTVGIVDPGLVATALTGDTGRDPTDVAELFQWAALECPAEKLDGEIVGLREWKQATR